MAMVPLLLMSCCRVRRRTLQMSRSLKGKILLEEMGRMTVTRRCFLATMWIVEPYYAMLLRNSKSHIFSQDGRKYKKKGRRANARDFIIDEAEVNLTKP